jgi:hypothetical protein
MKTWRKHSLNVSALPSRKGGWSGIRLAFRRELPTLKLGFSLPFLSSLKQRIPSGKGCFLLSLQTLCESSEMPNPPVVQKRDPRTFPRFALKKVLACLQHSILIFCFPNCIFHVSNLIRRSTPFEKVSLRDVWRLICIYIYIWFTYTV